MSSRSFQITPFFWLASSEMGNGVRFIGSGFLFDWVGRKN